MLYSFFLPQEENGGSRITPHQNGFTLPSLEILTMCINIYQFEKKKVTSFSVPREPKDWKRTFSTLIYDHLFFIQTADQPNAHPIQNPKKHKSGERKRERERKRGRINRTHKLNGIQSPSSLFAILDASTYGRMTFT